jgi:hypothetical protein
MVLRVMAPCSLIGRYQCFREYTASVSRVEVSKLGKVAGCTEVGRKEKKVRGDTNIWFTFRTRNRGEPWFRNAAEMFIF